MSNPFEELLGAGKEAESAESAALNALIEDVFHLTIRRRGAEQSPLVYLEELASALAPRRLLDLEALEQAVFERVLLEAPASCVTPEAARAAPAHVVEPHILPYLYTCMRNVTSYETGDERTRVATARMKELIYRNAVTALRQPALFPTQELPKQLADVLRDVDPACRSFFLDLVREFMAEGDSDAAEQLKVTMKAVLLQIHVDLFNTNILKLPMYVIPALQLFANNQHLAPILLDSCQPKNRSHGRDYQETLFGALLSLSALPRTPFKPPEFFDNPLDQSAINLTEMSLWNATKHLTDNLHKLFLALLKSGPDAKNRTLEWIGNCLKTNTARGKLWTMEADINQAAQPTVSDGFMLNLGAVLLRLCQPFCTKHDDPKALKIDPTYCAVPPAECSGKSVHMDFLAAETCLLPAREADDGTSAQRATAPSYNFVTECFFMAHKCIDLGFRVCSEKLFRLGQEIVRMQRMIEDIAGANGGSPMMQTLQQRLKPQMMKYVSLRCVLMEPESLGMLTKLNAVTCTWLVQLAIHPDQCGPQTTYAPTTLLPVVMPITVEPPDTLRCVPEFVLENMVMLVSVIRRSASPGRNTTSLSDADLAALYDPALTLVLTYMGDSRRMYNPHLRARLAECLEAMLPEDKDNHSGMSNLASFYREQLFKEHPHRLQLVACLLDVFVGIEMTGQSVQFEQKFNYRRPMYLVMDFLWETQEHKDCFTKLAREAESNMEAVQPPLFLRFVNLLMNDAIFLLDEALNNMAQIRTMQAAQDAGEWANLSAEERSQNLSNLSHIGMLARFDNILGRDTTRTLVRMTEHAPYVFCHPTLVDRVAGMLNYFLLNLVGPNKKNFKVKDGKEFEFEPANTVLDICRMYVQLGSSDHFCQAVSDDGRSYSPRLFQDAEAVLVRIGGGGLVGSLQELASRVAVLAVRRQADEEALSNAPDEFLDPIMSTIMLDPVVLPSSRTTVDRTTIARHLLSDQSDPFNRSPLTMDQVKSDVELKGRIHAWIAQRRLGSSQQTDTG